MKYKFTIHIIGGLVWFGLEIKMVGRLAAGDNESFAIEQKETLARNRIESITTKVHISSFCWNRISSI